MMRARAQSHSRTTLLRSLTSWRRARTSSSGCPSRTDRSTENSRLLMNTRQVGRLGWPVSEIGYGMWGMAGWSGSDDDRSREALDEAVRLGCNFFDTAWGYGTGHSERLLGALVRRHPEKRLYTAS